MLGRTITVVAASLLACLPAAADPKAICKGKYALAAEIVDAAFAKYDTLYSGGGHFYSRDETGATIDFYRLMKGWPDLQLRKSTSDYGLKDPDLHGDRTPQLIWDKASWALRANAPADATDAQRYWAAWGLDILTSAGPTADWWRLNLGSWPWAQGLPPMEAGWPVGYAGHTEQWIAQKARTEPALDWLQMILAASNAPWSNNLLVSEALAPETASAHARLSWAAFQLYKEGKGDEWLVAAVLNDPGAASELRTPLDLTTAIKDCTATPQKYALWAVTLPAIQRHRFPLPQGEWVDIAPEQIHRVVANLGIRALLIGNWTYMHSERATLVAELDKIAVPRDWAWHSAYNLTQLYYAERIADVPLSTAPKMMRAYNLLSADDLAALARRPKAAPPIARAAFARQVALGQLQDAKTLLPLLKSASPQESAAIDRIWAGKETEAVRLSLIVMATPGLSTLVRFDERGEFYDRDYGLVQNARYTAMRRNLPPEYRTAGILQRDFETLLYAPQRDYAYETTRGFTLSYLRRVKNRGSYDRHAGVLNIPKLIADGPGDSIPFNRLIAWGELSRLTGEDRLMHAIARTILPWAERESRIKGKQHETAEVLARLVFLCRWNSCGEIGGIPAQQRAFQILHARLPNTAGAERTTVWWPNLPDT